jgi:hypothetical protein
MMPKDGKIQCKTTVTKILLAVQIMLFKVTIVVFAMLEDAGQTQVVSIIQEYRREYKESLRIFINTHNFMLLMDKFGRCALNQLK